MKNPHIVDRPPPTQFADRLEGEFLRAAGAVDAETIAAMPEDRSPEPIEETTVTIQLDPPTTDRAGKRPGWVLAAAAAAVLVIVGLVAVLNRAGDRDGEPAGGTPITFTVLWEYSDVRTECNTNFSPKECLNRFDMPATTTFTGGVSGSGFQALYWNDPVDYPGRDVDHLEHVAAYQVRGTVEGCGSGDFTIVEVMQFVSGPNRDRDTGTYTGTWQIVPESGREALATLAGNGTTTANFQKAATEGRTFTGTLTCG